VEQARGRPGASAVDRLLQHAFSGGERGRQAGAAQGDLRLLTGAGRFTDDLSLPRQAHAAMVRSPHPHARIVRVDTARALAMPGVLGVYTGATAPPTDSPRSPTIPARDAQRT